MRLVRTVVVGGAPSGGSSKHSSATFVQGFRSKFAHTSSGSLCQCSVHSVLLNQIDFKVAVVCWSRRLVVCPSLFFRLFSGIFLKWASCRVAWGGWFLSTPWFPPCLPLSITFTRPAPADTHVLLLSSLWRLIPDVVYLLPHGQICHLFPAVDFIHL